MQPFDDPTSQEMNRQNEELIKLLEQLLEQETQTFLPLKQDSAQRQAIENVRHRLLAWEQQAQASDEESSPSLLPMPGMQQVAPDLSLDDFSPVFRTPFIRTSRLVLGIAAIMLVALISAGIFAQFAFQQQQAGTAGTSGQDLGSVQRQAQALVLQFHHEADTWGRQHPYFDRFDGKTYPLDLSYTQGGLASELDYALNTATSVDDYILVGQRARDALFTLHQFESNQHLALSPNVPHQSDFQLLKFHHVEQKQVLVVSLSEQYMRLYQQGHLQTTFAVQAGNLYRPIVPGAWVIINQRKFSVGPGHTYQGQPGEIYLWDFAENKDSPHAFHMFCSVWENDLYGPGSQFPHPTKGEVDWYGITFSRSDGTWLHRHTNLDLQILIY